MNVWQVQRHVLLESYEILGLPICQSAILLESKKTHMRGVSVLEHEKRNAERNVYNDYIWVRRLQSFRTGRLGAVEGLLGNRSFC